MLHIKKKGIVLITTLLTVVLVVMMITAVVHSGASSLSLTAGFHNRENALLAAESGVQYAATRLQDNMFWQGEGGFTGSSGSSSYFEGNGLKVVEDNGNVVGVITSKTGTVSAFRIKFNYEDGNQEDRKLPDKDGLHDPSNDFRINSKFVSVNNLTNPSSTLIYRANDNGKKALSQAETYYIPGHTACIIVEGLAGSSLREVTSPNQIGEKSHPEVYEKAVKRVVECYLSFDDNEKIDGAAYAGGNIYAELGNKHKKSQDGKGKFRVYNKNSDECPFIRSLNNIVINPSEEAKNSVYQDNRTVSFHEKDRENVTPGADGKFILNGEQKEVNNTCTQEDFHRIEWDDIKKASTTDPTLAGGTYVWIKTSDNRYDLMHSDRVYRIPPKSENADNPTNPDDGNNNTDPDLPIEKNISQTEIVNNTEEWKTISQLPNGMHIDHENMIIYVDNNIQVTDTKGIAIRTASEVNKRAFVAITPAANSMNSSIITTAGNIDIEGGLIGSGSLTSEGEITCQGASVMEADPETGVSMYAKGDINLQAITKVPEGNNDSDPSSWQIDISQYASESVDGSDEGNNEDEDSSGGLSGLDDEEEGVVIEGKPSNGVDYGDDQISADEQERRRKAWEAKMKKLADSAKSLRYVDQDITGIIYTWGNFNCDIGNKALLSITGSIIAFGADPDNKSTKAGTTYELDENGNFILDEEGNRVPRGNINIKARRVNLTFDSTAYNGIMGSTGGYTVKRKMWTAWQ